MNSLLRGAGLSLALLLFSTAASADPLILIDLSGGGFGEIIVQDDTLAGVATPFGVTTHADGSFGSPGAVTFVGSAGDFDFNVVAGLTKPRPGHEQNIHLGSINSTTSTAAAAAVYFTDSDFVLGSFVSGGTLSYGGSNTAGTTQVAASIDDGNALIGPPDAFSPIHSGAFSGVLAWNEAIAAGTPFSITAAANIIHTRAGSSSVDIDVTATPEPGSIALCGLAVLGFAVYRRRRNKA